MPLTFRNIPHLLPHPQAKSSRKVPSKIKVKPNAGKINCRISKGISSQNNENQTKLVNKLVNRKNMYSVMSCRALLKKAREIDINDPKQSYLPSSRSKEKKAISRSPEIKLRKFSDNTQYFLEKESPRIFTGHNKKRQLAKTQCNQINIQQENRQQEASSLTRLILFGLEQSILEKPAIERISIGQACQLQAYLNHLNK